MSYDIIEERSYNQEKDVVYKATLGAIEGLEGKMLSGDEAAGTIKVNFNKKILGKVLGDRTQFEIEINDGGDGSEVKVLGYPIDPVGRKLMFGARKGVTKTVMGWFWAHLEHRL